MDKNWNEILYEEDKLIQNSDKRYYRHSLSIEYVSEEMTSRIAVENQYIANEPFHQIQEQEFLQMLENKKLYNAMQSLTPLQRKVIQYHFFNGLRVKEIAETMGYAPNTITEILHRALKKLKTKLNS